MKDTTSMSGAVKQLERMFTVLNKDKFDNELPMPIITVMKKPGTFGHMSMGKVWKQDETGNYELNIEASHLGDPIEQIIDTMIHEMVHLYCNIKDIQDVSRGGKYHNKRFKQEAEKRGLQCFECGQYGWNTKPHDGLIEYALSKGWTKIQLGREKERRRLEGGRKPSSTRKYICPCCNMSVRATKVVNIWCGDCNCPMSIVH